MVTVDPGDRIHFLDWGGDGRRGAAAGVRPHPRAARDGLDLGAGRSPARRADAHHRHGPARPRAVGRPDRGGRLRPRGAGRGRRRGRRGLGRARPGRCRRAGRARRAWLRGDRGGARRRRRSDRAAPGLVLVDGGWERQEDATGVDVDEFLRGLDEPPEVLASMRAFLRDRRDFDPATWDADQERAAGAEVVETRAGRVVPTTRPHALEATRPHDVRRTTRSRPWRRSARRSSPCSPRTTRPAIARPRSRRCRRLASMPVGRRSGRSSCPPPATT